MQNYSRISRILDHLHEIAIAVPKIGAGKLAAAVVYKGEIACIGVNQLKTHPLQSKYTKNPLRDSLHAEIAAIVRYSRIANEDDFRKASIFVARTKRVGQGGKWGYGLARPCAGCFSCIQAFGFKEIWYTEDGPNFGHIRLR